MSTNLRYSISESGRYPVGPFATIKEARATLREMVRESSASCRRRFGKAYVHKHDDCYVITLASDERSALWASFGIIAA